MKIIPRSNISSSASILGQPLVPSVRFTFLRMHDRLYRRNEWYINFTERQTESYSHQGNTYHVHLKSHGIEKDVLMERGVLCTASDTRCAAIPAGTSFFILPLNRRFHFGTSKRSQISQRWIIIPSPLLRFSIQPNRSSGPYMR